MTETETTCTGLIVAGGRSRRFGETEKALARVDGVPMIRHVADRLTTVTDELVVNCRRQQRDAFAAALDETAQPARFAVDLVPDCGPVYGLRTGLRVATGQYTVVLACDVPFVEPAVVTYLLETAHGETGAVPAIGGYRQPLCAVYNTATALTACEKTLACGARELREVISRVNPVVVDESNLSSHADPSTLHDVDTKHDLSVLSTVGR